MSSGSGKSLVSYMRQLVTPRRTQTEKVARSRRVSTANHLRTPQTTMPPVATVRKEVRTVVTPHAPLRSGWSRPDSGPPPFAHERGSRPLLGEPDQRPRSVRARSHRQIPLVIRPARREHSRSEPRTELSEDSYAQAWAERRSLSLEAAIVEALAVQGPHLWLPSVHTAT
jgi:hypothetical protein